MAVGLGKSGSINRNQKAPPRYKNKVYGSAGLFKEAHSF